MSEVRKLFEKWFKQEFAWELKRTMHLRHLQDFKYEGVSDEYVHVEVQKYYRAFKAAFEIIGETK